LISVVILRFANGVAEVDTWLMSCRVLKREVEEVVLNEMMRLAQGRGCGEIRGVYLPTSKNALVGELYPQMGFSPYLTNGKDEGICYTLKTAGFSPKKHHIKIQT
jgi:predicted enzyme involved in methoxymalonyl-ACP biosynthesis